jgi:hypothetical protein
MLRFEAGLIIDHSGRDSRGRGTAKISVVCHDDLDDAFGLALEQLKPVFHL